MEILVDKGIISEIGKNVTKPDNYLDVDLSNYTVTPGLMDLHIHLSITPDPVLVENTIQDYILTSNYAKLLTAVSNVNKLLMSGFTTIRDTGEPFSGTAMVDLRNAIEKGEITGSRLIVAPHVATTIGAHGDLTPAVPTNLEGLNVEGGGLVGDVDVREFVRNEVSIGADWIKIIGNGAFFEPLHSEDVQSWTDEEIKTLIEEGINWGKPVAIHAHIPHTIQLAVNSGVSSVEHGSLVDNKTIELMKEKGTALIPTLNNFDFLVPVINKTWLSLQPDYIVERVKKNATDAQEARVLIVKSTDLNIGYGSDAGYAIPIEDNWKEFYSMVESGFTPIRALKTATSVAADIIDRPDLGTLEVNKTADIAAWDGDITQDIEAIKKNVFIMKEGKLYKTPK
jgi:tryptophan 2-monooxygenase